jgi:basic membrane lipoprotein Med (substrate-binding protein (PBP1-ABC) superfamily)
MIKRFFAILATAIFAMAFVASCTKENKEPTTTPQVSPTQEVTVVPEQNEKRDVTVGLIYIANDPMSLLHTKQINSLDIDDLNLTIKSKEVADGNTIPSINELANEGCSIIFCVGAEENDVKTAAQNNPNIKFEIYGGIDGQQIPNVSTYYARFYQQQYINGMFAGYLTKSNSIGFVADNADNEGIRQANAFALGVYAVNSDAKVHFTWGLDALDDNSRNDIFANFLLKKCDIITERYISNSLRDFAQNNDILLIGNAQQGDNIINTKEIDISGYAKNKIVDFVNGTYMVNDIVSGWKGLDTKMVQADTFSSLLTDEQQQTLKDKINEMETNTWDVFTGPIVDTYGTKIVFDGQRIPDADLRFMLWYVNNIEATSPPAG